MPRPIAFRAAVVAATLALSAAPLAAQDAPCTYDACALRIEPDATGLGIRIARGAEGAPVGRIAAFRSDLSGLVEGSAPAVRLAERAERSRVRSFASVVGAGVLLSLITDGAPLDGSRDVRTGVAAASGGALLYALLEMTRASRLSSEAVWEYNRGLDR